LVEGHDFEIEPLRDRRDQAIAELAGLSVGGYAARDTFRLLPIEILHLLAVNTFEKRKESVGKP
jgi:hypothetical protein